MIWLKKSGIGGIAGLRAAVHLAGVGRVVLLTKAHHPEESNTGYAQGGIAAAVGPDDSPDLHFRDTMAAGDGLWVNIMLGLLTRERAVDLMRAHLKSVFPKHY